jgi:rRNA maturation protein Nop10
VGRRKTSDMYRCANPACTRTTPLEITTNNGNETGAPPEHVHRTSDGLRSFTIICPNCGHYTVVSPYRPS